MSTGSRPNPLASSLIEFSGTSAAVITARTPGRASPAAGSIAVIADELVRHHDHAGRAEATLRRAVLQERTLDRMEVAVPGQPGQRGDGSAVGLDGEHGARVDRLPVQQHRARPAHALAAAVLDL